MWFTHYLVDVMVCTQWGCFICEHTLLPFFGPSKRGHRGAGDFSPTSTCISLLFEQNIFLVFNPNFLNEFFHSEPTWRPVIHPLLRIVSSHLLNRLVYLNRSKIKYALHAVDISQRSLFHVFHSFSIFRVQLWSFNPPTPMLLLPVFHRHHRIIVWFQRCP